MAIETQKFAVSNLLYPETLGGKILRVYNFSVYGVSVAGGGIIQGVSGARIRVHALVAVAGSACSLAFWDGGASAVFGPIPLAANGQLVLPWSPVGWFQVAEGTAINFWTNIAATVTGVAIYVEA